MVSGMRFDVDCLQRAAQSAWMLEAQTAAGQTTKVLLSTNITADITGSVDK